MSYSPVEIIAEVGQAHDGSLGSAHAYIDALAETGVKAVKFQVHIAHAESSLDEPFRINFSKQDSSRFDYWKRMEFTAEQWVGLKMHCEEKGLEFLASPFSIAAVNLLQAMDVRRYKIGSGEMSNLLMLECIARQGKPVILSSGLSTFDDLDRTIEFLRPFRCNLSILQCTTRYPTTASDIGLNVINELKERYDLPTGFSDHSGTTFASLAAVAHGAEIIEFHIVFDRRSFGPDSSSSIEVREIPELVRGINYISKAIISPIDKSNISVDVDLIRIFGKSLSVNSNLPVGHILRLEDLETKKPGSMGIPAAEYRRVIGSKLVRPLTAWDFITESDISD